MKRSVLSHKSRNSQSGFVFRRSDGGVLCRSGVMKGLTFVRIGGTAEDPNTQTSRIILRYYLHVGIIPHTKRSPLTHISTHFTMKVQLDSVL